MGRSEYHLSTEVENELKSPIGSVSQMTLVVTRNNNTAQGYCSRPSQIYCADITPEWHHRTCTIDTLTPWVTDDEISK